MPRLLPLLAAVAGATLAISARAETPPPTGDDAARAPVIFEPGPDPRPLSVGARAFVTRGLGYGGFGLGLDASYSLLPYLAVGGELALFAVDNPEYCEACILNGKSAIAFVEGRPWSAAWVTPYVRLGAGYSRLAGSMKSRDFGNRHEDIATLLGEIGVDVHHGWASARLFAFHLVLPGTSFDREPFNALGVQLGARL